MMLIEVFVGIDPVDRNKIFDIKIQSLDDSMIAQSFNVKSKNYSQASWTLRFPNDASTFLIRKFFRKNCSFKWSLKPFFLTSWTILVLIVKCYLILPLPPLALPGRPDFSYKISAKLCLIHIDQQTLIPFNDILPNN